jgi:hypothetical protein
VGPPSSAGLPLCSSTRRRPARIHLGGLFAAPTRAARVARRAYRARTCGRLAVWACRHWKPPESSPRCLEVSSDHPDSSRPLDDDTARRAGGLNLLYFIKACASGSWPHWRACGLSADPPAAPPDHASANVTSTHSYWAVGSGAPRYPLEPRFPACPSQFPTTHYPLRRQKVITPMKPIHRPSPDLQESQESKARRAYTRRARSGRLRPRVRSPSATRGN